jgi:predicted MFS family arabinose efflux permease
LKAHKHYTMSDPNPYKPPTAGSDNPPEPHRSERLIVFLVGAVQFINILDFMMVMPLGPDFAKALGVPQSELGLIGGSYTAAAALAGVAGSRFLDRFDRRSALAVAMAGLALGTAAGGFATGLATLVAARILAGLFGGPATSISLAIIADVIPPERRGKAMGAVMGAFAVASVFGVPAGLELARWGSWRTPFFCVAATGVVVAGISIFLLPTLRGHLADRAKAGTENGFFDLIRRRAVILSYLMTAVVMVSGFILIPNISAYVQSNMHYPREHLGRLYAAGGAVAFATLRLVGALVDRFGPFRVGATGTALTIAVTYVSFYSDPPYLPPMAMFIGFMMASSFRNVAYQTLTSKVPLPHERARFMSFQSAVQHAAGALGAILSTQMLYERPDKSLGGMAKVSAVSMALAAVLPVLFWLVEAEVKRRGIPPAAPPVAQPVDEPVIPSVH